jgi:hypothetical protein
MWFSVIPAEAGIQYFYGLAEFLDPGFRRGDGLKDFLRVRQPWTLSIGE